MNTAPFLRRHNPINMALSLAIVVLTTWLIVIFATAPGPAPGYGMTKQELKILRYSQAD